MKLRCRCGKEVPVPEAEAGRNVVCVYCGLVYALYRDDSGALGARPLAQGGAPPEPAPAPDQGPPALELDMPAVPPAAPTPAEPQPEPQPEPSAPPREAGPVPRSWRYYLADAWLYAFRGSAKWGLLVWLFLVVFVAPFLMLFPLLGLLVPLVIWGMLMLYEFELIRQSAFDAAAKPSLPKWDGFYESGFRPLGLMIAAVFGGGIPFILVLIGAVFVGNLGEADLIRALTGFKVVSTWSYALWAGFYLSVFMFPINALAVAMADSPGAINPRYTYPAAVRVIGPYILCCIFCWFCWWVGGRLSMTLREVIGPGFLGRFVGLAAWLYMITVAARALGTLHYAYSDKMGWME